MDGIEGKGMDVTDAEILWLDVLPVANQC